MPNHVENHIEFSGDKHQIDTILKQIKNDKYGVGTINFNKIIPMPETLNIESGSKTDHGLRVYREFIEAYTSGRSADEALKALENIPAESENAFFRQRTDIQPDEWALGKTAWHNIKNYGVPTWYEWSINNWGTKWNAYGYKEGTDYSTGNGLAFQTAWSAPYPVLLKLSEMYPEIILKHQWADEDIGNNCGERIYLGGAIIDQFIPEGIRAAEFALEIWNYDPAELGLVKNSTGTAYINIEYGQYQVVRLLGRTALFTNGRLTVQDIPKGFYCYDLRYSDDGSRFSAVEPRVAVNHGGSVITDEPLDFGEKGYISFTEDTEPNFLGEDLSIGQFLRGEYKQTKTNEQIFGDDAYETVYPAEDDETEAITMGGI